MFYGDTESGGENIKIEDVYTATGPDGADKFVCIPEPFIVINAGNDDLSPVDFPSAKGAEKEKIEMFLALALGELIKRLSGGKVLADGLAGFSKPSNAPEWLWAANLNGDFAMFYLPEKVVFPITREDNGLRGIYIPEGFDHLAEAAHEFYNKNMDA